VVKRWVLFAVASHKIAEIDLDQPMYTTAEASRLVGLGKDRVRRWLQGYSYISGPQKRLQRPVIKRIGSVGTSYASFLDLIDLLFVKEFLEHPGISLQQLRKALSEASDILNTNHFARQIFFTDGKNIWLKVKEKGDAILELLSGGQWVISSVIEDLAHQIDFDPPSELARRWYPLGSNGLIVLDPFVSFGRPTIVGKGVATSNVYDFFVAEGQVTRPVCKWLSLTRLEVEAAVEFEEQLAA
jgi:uncharacterized protein (DUF433 family)